MGYRNMKHKCHNHNCQCETEIVKIKWLLKCIQNWSCSKGLAAGNSNIYKNIKMNFCLEVMIDLKYHLEIKRLLYVCAEEE